MENYLRQEQIENFLFIWLDQPNSSINTLRLDIEPQIKSALSHLNSDPKLKAAILLSAKKDNFVAGADIEQFKTLRTPQEAQTFSLAAQNIMQQIADSKKPIIAVIHGACLGGGLELALACHWRIATNHPKTLLGLPEVSLGILPAAGGTQRLPRLIGLPSALDLMLSGKRISAKQAFKLGLVDELILPYDIQTTAILAAKDFLAKNKRHPSHTIKNWLLLPFATRAARKQIAKVKDHYPAAEQILDVTTQGLLKGQQKGLRLEAEAFGNLVGTKTSENLTRLFFLQQSHKKNPHAESAKPVEQIGIAGAGFMGSGIALVSVSNNYRVKMQDVRKEAFGKASSHIWQELSKQQKRGRLAEFEKTQTMSRLSFSTDLKELGQSDLIIEAIFEDLHLKRELIQSLEPHLNPNCIFASNTSALPIAELQKVSKRPEQMLGMHYFSPVHKMPLLEIINTKQTAKEALATATQVGIKQGKTVIVVNDGPGFYTSRILAPWMDEAIILAREGMPFQAIDDAVTKLGFPVGPITLMDEVGIDVAAHVAQYLGRIFGERVTHSDWHLFDEILKAKFLGKKSGKGFYLHNSRTKVPNPALTSILAKFPSPAGGRGQGEGGNRIFLRMVNEAFYCLQESILNTPEDGDIGAVFGLGFPAYLGGPFKYVDDIGPKRVIDQLHALETQHGARFTPAQVLIDLSRK